MLDFKTLFSARYILSYLGFLCTLVVYFCRVNLSIAIVAMTEEKNTTLTNGTIVTESDFDWSTNEQTNLLGSYFYGYVCTQIPGAYLSSRFGFKWILFTTTLITSIITIVTPFLADLSYISIFISRIILGLFHGVTFPVLQGKHFQEKIGNIAQCEKNKNLRSPKKFVKSINFFSNIVAFTKFFDKKV